MQRDNIGIIADDGTKLLSVDVISNNGKDVRTILYDGDVEALGI